MRGAVHGEHAAGSGVVAHRAGGDVRDGLLLPEGLERSVADPSRRLPLVSRLHLPVRVPAQVGVCEVIQSGHPGQIDCARRNLRVDMTCDCLLCSKTMGSE